MSTLAPSPAPARNVDDASLVYHINLLFVALLGVAVLVRLPRAIARFGTSSDWLNGHIFRYRQLHSNSNSSHSPYNNYHDEKRPRPPIVLNFPPHIASCIKPLRPLLTPLRARLAPGFTVGQVLILIVYFYTIVYAGFYRSNVFTDSARTGWIAIAQLPFVFAFAQKNNILGGLLGYGYERLNFLHRFAGRLVVLAANIHSLHYCYSWSLAGTFTKSIQRPSSMWGMVALVCLDVIFLFSTQAVRNKAYNLFLSSHIVAFILVLPAVYLHKPTMLPYVYACLVIYIADIFFRCIKSRITTAYIRPIPELDLTRVEIPSVNAGWRAGQHVRLRVCSMRMGWIGWTEVHPFTIASVAKSEEGMVLMCKKAGDWTNKLYEVAKRGAYTEGGVGSEVSVVLDGPYGGPGHTIYASFSAAVLIVGGSGITYALSVIQDLIQKDLVGESRVKIIELVWIVTDPACLSPLLPIFKQMIAMSVHTPVRISVFYSRAPTGKQPAFFSSVEAGPFTSPDLASRNEKDQQQGVQRRPSAPQRNMSTRTKVRTILQAEGHQFTIPPVPGIVSPISPTGGEADYLPRPRPPPSRRPSSPYKSPRAAPQPPKPALLQTQLQGREQESGESGADLQRQESSASTSSNTHESNSPISRYAPAYAPSQSPHFPPGLTLAPGKPKLVKFLEHALQRAVTLSHAHGRRERAKSEGRPSGMVVGVCGPVGLADDVAGAVGALDPVRRDQVGGVEMCEEVFGW